MTLRSSRMMVRKSSSVSRWNDCRRLPSKSGESGLRVLQLAQEQPLPGEVRDERVGARIGQHPAHLPLERAPDPSARRARPRRAARRPECCSTGRTTAATPARDRSPGTRRPARRCAGSRSNRNRNCGSTSTRATRALDAGLERALLAPGAIELEQRLHLGAAGRHRTAIRARRERVQDLRRARHVRPLQTRACRSAAAAGSACRRVPSR